MALGQIHYITQAYSSLRNSQDTPQRLLDTDKGSSVCVERLSTNPPISSLPSLSVSVIASRSTLADPLEATEVLKEVASAVFELVEDHSSCTNTCETVKRHYRLANTVRANEGQRQLLSLDDTVDMRESRCPADSLISRSISLFCSLGQWRLTGTALLPAKRRIGRLS